MTVIHKTTFYLALSYTIQPVFVYRGRIALWPVVNVIRVGFMVVYPETVPSAIPIPFSRLLLVPVTIQPIALTRWAVAKSATHPQASKLPDPVLNVESAVPLEVKGNGSRLLCI